MLKVLLAPLRLFVGWGISPRLLSILSISMLVMLRLTIGWHFYSEGVDKRDAGNWTATPFFANARGPFADEYRELVWDYDGSIRLDVQTTKIVFATFRDAIKQHYGFDKRQAANAQKNYAAAVKQHEWVLNEYAADLEEFNFGRTRLSDLDQEQDERRLRSGVDSLGAQRETIRREWIAKGKPALDKLNSLWKNYETEQNALATTVQVEENGYLRMPRPTASKWRIDTATIDRIVPYFDIAIGLCLLLGCFTPVAALAAAGFLGSVFLSQYPPATGPGSTNYQLVEGMACLVLAATGSGRFAGLDYFWHLIVRRIYTRHDAAS
ncbi:MAG: DoxX family protein [Planctomycetota bacterium]